MSEAPKPAEHDPYAAMRVRDFRRYLSGNFVSILGMQMQTTAVQWEIYQRAGKVEYLGYVGLVQILPIICLTLVAGHVADRFDRKRVLSIALAALLISSLALASISALQGAVELIFVCLLVNGIARAFLQPARASLLPQIVPRGRFANAVTWNMGTFQLSSAVGPATAGLIIAFSGQPQIVYLLAAAASGWFIVLLSRIELLRRLPAGQTMTLESLTAGLRFVWNNRVLVGAMALDMFAVLLGGATALMPVYAKDILHVGPQGYGAMEAAPAVGALGMALFLAHRAPIERAGWSLLGAVAGFGVATICFGWSRWYPLTLAALLLVGALDNISVVIRHTLVQLLTPDEMRGRVSAVNSMFIGASNELGGYESALVAKYTSPTISVVAGGFGTLVVVGLVAWRLPPLRRYGALDSPRHPLDQARHPDGTLRRPVPQPTWGPVWHVEHTAVASESHSGPDAARRASLAAGGGPAGSDDRYPPSVNRLGH